MEISTITKKLTVTCFGILLFISILSGTIIWQSVIVEKERKQAEHNAKLQQEQLYQAGKMATIGTLAAGIAHEINNPITTILLNIPIIKEMWSNITPLIKQYADSNDNLHVGEMDFSELCDITPQLLDHIDDGARRISNIVGELKDFSRLSPPEMTNDVAINSAVEKSIALVYNLITESTENFYNDCKPDLPFFKGNLQKVEQVIVNLLINACQALQNENQMIRVSTDFDDASQSVTVSVEDSGLGIPPELLERIKDPFFTTKQSYGNTGLGLAISDRIMKDHGGKITFTSSPEKGTLAILHFPVCEKENV